jgi:hypothetical protein
MDKTPVITEPCIRDGLPNEIYHSDCCPAPSLSSSGAKVLSGDDPAAAFRFWAQSPMNPAREREEKRAFDIGNAAHLICLEPHLFQEKTWIIQADDYRTKLAQAERDEARAEGRIPLLAHEAEMVRGIRDVLLDHPIAKHAFVNGTAERSYFWIDPEYGVWRKVRLDYAPVDPLLRIVDLKTTTDANPVEFKRRAADLGYHQSAAFYMDAIDHFHGERPRNFYWVVVEKKAPYLISVCVADPEALAWGRLLNRRALDLFRRCLDKGVWPAYGAQAHIIDLPGWTVKELERRHAAGEFSTDAPAAMAAE